METGADVQPSPTPGEERPRELPPGSRMHRMSAHAQGLVDDLRTWVELRVRLAQMEVEEKVDEKVNELIRGAIMGVLAALAGFFALVTLALLLGWLIGHPFWGFLIVTLLLVIVVVVVRSAEPRIVKIAKGFVRIESDTVSRGRPASSDTE